MLEPDGILTAVHSRPAAARSHWGKRLAAVQVDLDAADEALVADPLADGWEQKAPARLRRNAARVT